VSVFLLFLFLSVLFYFFLTFFIFIPLVLFFVSFLFSTERQVQAVLAVLLMCISFEIAGDPFYRANERYRILGRLELSTLFVQWATMWCGSMIYASQDQDSERFVIFLTLVVAAINFGMFAWLVLRLIRECVREEYGETEGSESTTEISMREMLSDLRLSVQRWRYGRMSEEQQSSHVRSRTVDAENSAVNDNPFSSAIELMELEEPSIQFMEQEKEEDSVPVDVPVQEDGARMHPNPMVV
jgi:hypothetical protein